MSRLASGSPSAPSPRSPREHRTTERREAASSSSHRRPRRRRRSSEPSKCPEPSDVVRASVEDSAEPATENTAPSDERRRPGWPRHQQAPVIRSRELDRLLVFGEVSMNDDGTSNTVYRTLPRAGREVRRRSGASSPTTPKSHNTMHRRSGEHRIGAGATRRSSGTRDRRGDHGRRDAHAHRRVLIKFRRRS